jgi:hypothetical protein
MWEIDRVLPNKGEKGKKIEKKERGTCDDRSMVVGDRDGSLHGPELS